MRTRRKTTNSERTVSCLFAIAKRDAIWLMFVIDLKRLAVRLSSLGVDRGSSNELTAITEIPRS